MAEKEEDKEDIFSDKFDKKPDSNVKDVVEESPPIDPKIIDDDWKVPDKIETQKPSGHKKKYIIAVIIGLIVAGGVYGAEQFIEPEENPFSNLIQTPIEPPPEPPVQTPVEPPPEPPVQTPVEPPVESNPTTGEESIIDSLINIFIPDEDETKPDETKPDETKPDETKPDETKPDRSKPTQPSGGGGGGGGTRDTSTTSDKVELEKTNDVIGYYLVTSDGDWYGDFVDFRKVPDKIEKSGNLKVNFRCFTDEFHETSTYFATFRNVIEKNLTVEVYINGLEVQSQTTTTNRALILEGNCLQ